MFGNSSSWFPVKNFTKSGCHFDWMLGATKFFGIRDFLTSKNIPKMATVLWNRTFNANISLETYKELQKTKDPKMIEKCKEIGLPLDIRV
jgi:hypothetical protein